MKNIASLKLSHWYLEPKMSITSPVYSGMNISPDNTQDDTHLDLKTGLHYFMHKHNALLTEDS